MDKIAALFLKDPTLIPRALAGDPTAIATITFYGGVATLIALGIKKK